MLSESEKIDWNIQACRAMVSASGSGMWGMRLICWNSSFGTTRSTSRRLLQALPALRNISRYAAIPLKIEVQPNESCRVAPGPNLQLVYRYESFEPSAGPDT